MIEQQTKQTSRREVRSPFTWAHWGGRYGCTVNLVDGDDLVRSWVKRTFNGLVVAKSVHCILFLWRMIIFLEKLYFYKFYLLTNSVFEWFGQSEEATSIFFLIRCLLLLSFPCRGTRGSPCRPPRPLDNFSPPPPWEVTTKSFTDFVLPPLSPFTIVLRKTLN